MKGIVLYDGVSQLHKKTPIVCIATLETSNVKTGRMIQTWILRKDMAPHTAVKNAQDYAICGDCKYSGGNGCYVVTFQAPLQIYKSYLNGNYPMYRDSFKKYFMGRNIRLGAYGDPAAVPKIVWQNVLRWCNNHTGYTHQWHKLDKSWQFLMASVDSRFERALAKDKGWRTFNVITQQDDTPEGSVLCPATIDTSDVQCNSCKLCAGNRIKAKDIHVKVHGSTHTIRKATNAVANVN